MPTLFSRIISGALPGRFVWRDPQCVAFLTIAPLKPGHVLVVPVREIDNWIDMDPGLTSHVFAVAQKIARGMQTAFPCRKVGVLVAGLEVPHAHVHLVPIEDLHDLDFDRQDHDADPRALDDAAAHLRIALRKAGHPEVSE